jgi:antitoxin ParD1/3/4
MAVKQRTRNIALTPHFDRFVQGKIDSGRYQSASEVVRESLRLMEQYEHQRRRALAELREKIRVGYEQVKRGDTVDPDEVYAEINAMSRAARKAAARKTR